MNLQSLEHPARTGVAAMLSLLAARVLRLPEGYWAAITTMIVMQSTLGAALTISVQRFTGTALGAAVGAVVVTYFGSNALIFGVTVFVIGMVCAILRIERNAYRFAGIALAIVMLVEHVQTSSAKFPGNGWLAPVDAKSILGSLKPSA